MCGVFGCTGFPNAVDITLNLGLCVQHRGQETAGVAVFNPMQPQGMRLKKHCRIGPIGHLREKLQSADMPGTIAIGHNRYGTTGGSGLANAHPIVRKIKGSHVAIVHNGDLVKIEFEDKMLSIDDVHQKLDEIGIPFETGSDTEIILHLLARERGDDIVSKVLAVLNRLHGAFSLLILWNGYLIAARDPWGIRPLWLGKDDSGYVLASEDNPLKQLGFKPIREVQPGEVIFFDQAQNITTFKLKNQPPKLAHCAFEYVYFARPDSIIFGQSVSEVRKRFGRKLVQELADKGQVPKIDIVIPVLDSGAHAGLSFAMSSGIPLDFGLLRNHYSGRNFITPGQDERRRQVRIKHSVDETCVKGKRVGVVDDSIVRATTAQCFVDMLTKAGASEVHVLIPSPRITHSCFYGLDTKKREALAASSSTTEEIRCRIGANSLHYLSLDGFKECLGRPENFCLACFSGIYPIQVT